MKPTPTSAKARRGPRAPLALVFALAALLALPLVAQAAHWPNFGGDPGHSGNQPVEVAELPTEFEWTGNDAGTVRNSIITTGGPDAASQFLAYGKTIVNTDGGSDDMANVYLRNLETGAHKIPEAQRDVDDGTDDTDAFGAGAQGVSFVDSSTDEGPGQLFVVHNDTNRPAKTGDSCPVDDTPTSSTNDIAIAQFDIATGAKKADFAVGRAAGMTVAEGEVCEAKTQVSDGYTVESSPVITPPIGSQGIRYVYFIARKDTAGPARLFGVKITNAGSASAVMDTDAPQIRDVDGANTKASPTLVYLNTPDQLQGGTTLYVAVPVNGAPGAADIRTFQVGDIADPTEDGPAATGFSGTPQTISVPVTENGHMPGQANSGVTRAPALYAAFDNGDDTTTVRKFVQQGASANLTEDTATTPTPVEGAPAPALALSVLSAGSGEIEGRVVLTTSKNLILLDSETVTPVDRLADSGETLGAGDAFARNTASVSGDLVFVTNDDGTQAVLNLSNAEPVGDGFTPNEANQGADFALGQPSYSRGFLQFLTDRGVFVYRTGVVVPPNEVPVAAFTATPNPANVNQPIVFDASASSDPEGTVLTYEWDFDGNGTFEVNRGNDPMVPGSFPAPGSFPVTLRVTDEGGARSTTTNTITVNPPPPNQAPSAAFSVSPNPAKADERVTFDASTSSDPDGSIARYEWDLDDNGTFETNSGTNPRVQRSYDTPKVYNVKLRVTDNAGRQADAVRQLTVSRGGRGTPRVTSKVTPTHDRKLPYVFKTTGRVTPPAGYSRAESCKGRVTISIKSGKKTISRRTTALTTRCTFRSSVTFRDRKRIGRKVRSLRFTARFQGNDALGARQARTKRVRIS